MVQKCRAPKLYLKKEENGLQVLCETDFHQYFVRLHHKPRYQPILFAYEETF